MEKRVMMVATVPSMIGQFNINNIKLLLDMGYQVEVASNFTDTGVWSIEQVQKFKNQMKELNVKCVQIDFSRKPLKISKHIASYRKLVKQFKGQQYSFIHTHTPIASVIVRLAAHKISTKVIYTAHGFHFCKTSPKKNWLIFYPVEWICAHWTDILVTINEEDYVLAKKRMHAKTVKYVPGAGIDMEQFQPKRMEEDEKIRKRYELSVRSGEKLALSVGELSHDKNHILMLKALKKDLRLNYKYIICGRGPYKKQFETFIKENGMEDKIVLLGFRNDISEILQVTDLFVFPSTFEGLPVALMEAIASKVMVVCSASRGNTDLVKDERCLFDYRSVDGLIKAIHNVENLTVEEKTKILEDNYSRLLPREKSRVTEIMRGIYQEAAEMPTQ